MITLTTLPQATAQEVFEQIANHLITQNAKSVDELHPAKICMYRSPFTKLKCAAGCLIADHEYESEYENNNWRELIVKHGISNNHADLIFKLQKLHDTYEPCEYKEKLIELGNRNDLDTTFLTNS